MIQEVIRIVNLQSSARCAVRAGRPRQEKRSKTSQSLFRSINAKNAEGRTFLSAKKRFDFTFFGT
jgi:hypothetical protein